MLAGPGLCQVSDRDSCPGCLIRTLREWWDPEQCQPGETRGRDNTRVGTGLWLVNISPSRTLIGWWWWHVGCGDDAMWCYHYTTGMWAEVSTDSHFLGPDGSFWSIIDSYLLDWTRSMHAWGFWKVQNNFKSEAHSQCVFVNALLPMPNP